MFTDRANSGTAVAVLRGDSNIKGTVTFEQANDSSPTTVSWNITGHDANAERGMHVHAFGDNTNGCTSAGPHCESPPHPMPPDARSAGEGNEQQDADIQQSTPTTRPTALPPMRSATSVIWATSRPTARAMPREAFRTS